MNVLLDDMPKPSTQIAANDVLNILDGEIVEPPISEASGAEFIIAFANLSEPDAGPKQGDILAKISISTGDNTGVDADAQSEEGNINADEDKLTAPPILPLFNDSTLLNTTIEVKLDDKIIPALQLTPIQIISTKTQIGQTITQEQGRRITAMSNILPPAITSSLMKILSSSLGTTLTLVKDKGINKTGNAAFVDIERIPEKTKPSNSPIVALRTVLPAQNLSEISANFPKTISHDFLPTQVKASILTQASVPVEDANLLGQTKAPIQTLTQISSQAAVQTQNLVVQVCEPMLEQLAAAHEALQDKISNKPKDVIVQLSPAELGRVQIRFSFDAGERVTAHIAAENPETLAVLRQKSGLLSAQLKLGGFESIDLSFDASGQKNFSGQNTGAEFSRNYNGQSKPDFWQVVADEKDIQSSSREDAAYPVRSNMDAQFAQIDIIL